MSMHEIMTEDRRLATLRMLEADPDYGMNDSVVQSALAHLGHGVSRDVVRSDFAWLAEQGLVKVEIVAETVHVARLTGRGVDVAKGHAVVPGVKRPRPGG